MKERENNLQWSGMVLFIPLSSLASGSFTSITITFQSVSPSSIIANTPRTLTYTQENIQINKNLSKNLGVEDICIGCTTSEFLVFAL